MANDDRPTSGSSTVTPPPVVLPPGYPAPEQPPARIYTSIQGDWWDLIALRVYGGRRGDELLMHKLIEANYELRNVALFPAGLTVYVPDVATKTEVALVPWKKAVIA